MKQLFLASDFQFVADSILGKLKNISNKNIVYLSTALCDKKRDEENWVKTNKQKIIENGFTFDEYDMSHKSNSQIRDDLAKYQIIYVEGGNPFYLLSVARANHFIDYLKERIKDGMVYISMSAGSVVMGIDIAGAERPGHQASEYGVATEGFGLVDFTIMPHWGNPTKLDIYKSYKVPNSYNEKSPYILLSDNQYIEVQDDWYKIIDVTKE